MKQRKGVLALLLVVVPLMYTACFVHWERPREVTEYPGTITVEKGDGKMVILVETMYPPSDYGVYRIHLLDITTNRMEQITGDAKKSYSQSVQGKYVKIELSESVIQERKGLTSDLINWEIESVMLSGEHGLSLYFPNKDGQQGPDIIGP
ncbi:hypothetical protein AGMMS50267_09170 [Spirochaetia bacterium]|nr:hypothetical protein AGMMS50267_09170 [Spirochaetia bacterium]